MRLLLLIVSRRRDELESQTGRHPHTRVASVIYEEELEHPRPTGVGRTRGQFSLEPWAVTGSNRRPPGSKPGATHTPAPSRRVCMRCPFARRALAQARFGKLTGRTLDTLDTSQRGFTTCPNCGKMIRG